MTKKYSQSGDTIIEVLICIAIAAFAVGVAYGLAGRSLQQGIQARERTEALNLTQAQVEYLKKLHTQNPASLNAIKTGNNCLVINATNIQVRTNTGSPDTLVAGGAGSYSPECVSNGKYFFNIICVPSATGCAAASNSTFEVSTRWERIGGGQDKSSIVYRP